LAVTQTAPPHLSRAAVDRIGPGRATDVEVRLMNRVMFRSTPANAHVTAKLGPDQLMLEFERARALIDLPVVDERTPPWATLTCALAAGSLVFAGRRSDRGMVLAPVQHWQRPPPVCCWKDTALAAEPGMRLCGDQTSGHLWPGNWRCGGTCPPPPNENAGFRLDG